MVKNLPPLQERPGLDPWFGKIPWRREWQPIPVFLPGEFHGQRKLAGYSPWGCKESDTTDQARISEWVAIPSPGELLDPGTEPAAAAAKSLQSSQDKTGL